MVKGRLIQVLCAPHRCPLIGLRAAARAVTKGSMQLSQPKDKVTQGSISGYLGGTLVRARAGWGVAQCLTDYQAPGSM